MSVCKPLGTTVCAMALIISGWMISELLPYVPFNPGLLGISITDLCKQVILHQFPFSFSIILKESQLTVRD